MICVLSLSGWEAVTVLGVSVDQLCLGEQFRYFHPCVVLITLKNSKYTRADSCL